MVPCASTRIPGWRFQPMPRSFSLGLQRLSSVFCTSTAALSTLVASAAAPRAYGQHRWELRSCGIAAKMPFVVPIRPGLWPACLARLLEHDTNALPHTRALSVWTFQFSLLPYQVIANHLETFLATLAAAPTAAGLPDYVV